jgi:hypothetical protein
MKKLLLIPLGLAVVIAMAIITRSQPGWEPRTAAETRWDILGVLVVTGAVGIIQWVLNRWRPRNGKWANFGVYSVLGPLGLYAWLEHPDLWLIVPFAVVGVAILWFSEKQAPVVDGASPELS